jgi:hypothetical protein
VTVNCNTSADMLVAITQIGKIPAVTLTLGVSTQQMLPAAILRRVKIVTRLVRHLFFCMSHWISSKMEVGRVDLQQGSAQMYHCRYPRPVYSRNEESAAQNLAARESLMWTPNREQILRGCDLRCSVQHHANSSLYGSVGISNIANMNFCTETG